MQPDEFFSVPAIRDIFKEVWKQSETRKECATWIFRNALPPVYGHTALRTGEDSHANPGRPPGNAILQVHTHPQIYEGMKSALSPEPSTVGGNTGKGDWGVAIQTGKPVYVLSVFSIWKIMPVAAQPVKIKVSGSWL